MRVKGEGMTTTLVEIIMFNDQRSKFNLKYEF